MRYLPKAGEITEPVDSVALSVMRPSCVDPSHTERMARPDAAVGQMIEGLKKSIAMGVDPSVVTAAAVTTVVGDDSLVAVMETGLVKVV